METILIQALEGFIGLLRQLITNLLGNDAELWGNELKKFLRKEPCWISVIVDNFLTTGDKTIEQLVTDGKYNWSNSNLNSTNFPPSGGSGETKWEWKLFHFNKNISSEEADRRIVAEDPSNPWQSADVEHILSFGVKYPEEQREFPIVGLGCHCVLGVSRFVPYLYGFSTHRGVDLWCWASVWDASHRFLAVRKV